MSRIFLAFAPQEGKAATYCRSSHKEHKKLGFQQKPQQQSRAETDGSGSADLIFSTHKIPPRTVYAGWHEKLCYSLSIMSLQAARTSEMMGMQVFAPEPASSTTTMKARG